MSTAGCPPVAQAGQAEKEINLTVALPAPVKPLIEASEGGFLIA
jgi:hypothetical protein